MKTEAEIKRMKDLMHYVPGTHPNDLIRPEDKKKGGEIIDPNAQKGELELFPETPKDDGLRTRDNASTESGNTIGPRLLNERK